MIVTPLKKLPKHNILKLVWVLIFLRVISNKFLNVKKYIENLAFIFSVNSATWLKMEIDHRMGERALDWVEEAIRDRFWWLKIKEGKRKP